MRLKSFYGQDTKSVMNAIKHSLGEEAIIISTRQESDGRVRITAAIDEKSQSQKTKTQPELFDTKDHLSLIEEQFYYHGIPLDITEFLLDKIADFPSRDPGLAISSAFESSFHFDPLYLGTDANKTLPLLFIGQPGAGKTSTICKLATKAKLLDKSVSIITLDTVRAGAVDQLEHIAKLLDIDLLSLEDFACLDAAIDVYSHSDLILIDSPGLNPFSEADRQIYQSLISEIEIDPHFIMAAGGDPYEAQEISACFSEIGAKKMLMTKLDITRRYGSLISSACMQNISLTNYSNTPQITEDLPAFTPIMLTQLLFPNLSSEIKKKVTELKHKETSPMVSNQKPSLAHPPKTIAIASGKGGVGKTWFSITLAHAMSKAGLKVLLFDGDLGLANVDIQLGLMPERDLNSVISGKTSLINAITPYKEGGFDILAGHSGSGSLAALPPQKLARLKEDLFHIAKGYDLLLLDLGAGIDRPVRQFSATADMIIVLTTDEPTALTDAYAFLKLTHSTNPDTIYEVVVNQAKSRSEGEKTYEAIKKSCISFLDFAPPLGGVIRQDSHVRDTIRYQTPILTRHPGCEAAQDMITLTNDLIHKIDEWELVDNVA